MDKIIKLSSTKFYLLWILQYFRKILIKLINCLHRYKILEKIHVWFYIISIYLKIMINIKRSSSVKQFYFFIFLNRCTEWKVNFSICYPYFYGTKMVYGHKGLFSGGVIFLSISMLLLFCSPVCSDRKHQHSWGMQQMRVPGDPRDHSQIEKNNLQYNYKQLQDIYNNYKIWNLVSTLHKIPVIFRNYEQFLRLPGAIEANPRKRHQRPNRTSEEFPLVFRPGVASAGSS